MKNQLKWAQDWYDIIGKDEELVSTNSTITLGRIDNEKIIRNRLRAEQREKLVKAIVADNQEK